MKVTSFKNESSGTNSLMTGRRALSIVELVAQKPGGYLFSELSEKTGLSSASLTRLLKMLLSENWLNHYEYNNRYTIGARTLQMADDVKIHSPIIDIIKPIVRDLGIKLNHSACIATFMGDHFTLMVKTERYNSYYFLDVFTPNIDWINNGMGQFLLAHQPIHVVENIYQMHFKQDVPSEHLQLFEQIRRDGYLCRDEGLATRIMVGMQTDPSKPVKHVLAVTALTKTEPDTDAILNEVKNAADLIVRRLQAQGLSFELEI